MPLTLVVYLSILGSLRVKVQEWLSGCGKKHCSANCCNTEVKLLKSLHDFPKRFTSCNHLIDASLTYNDEDLDAWKCEAKRWARVLFLAVKKDHHLIPLFTVCIFLIMLYTNYDSHNFSFYFFPSLL
jgi:hypothetical protein